MARPHSLPEIWVTGLKLSAEDRRYVLASYVHRFTGDNVPDWARKPDGSIYPLQFKNDADWLANTLFLVRKDGTLSKRIKNCKSNPTWPNNPELRD